MRSYRRELWKEKEKTLYRSSWDNREDAPKGEKGTAGIGNSEWGSWDVSAFLPFPTAVRPSESGSQSSPQASLAPTVFLQLPRRGAYQGHTQGLAGAGGHWSAPRRSMHNL